jgi:hypothetical protein
MIFEMEEAMSAMTLVTCSPETSAIWG